ncbi:MAG TPA: hypothetical protein PKL97_00385 [Candidatus Omnitrophota bacterium]|nr:hypothetical protein [Candidatus Omnitrophota bacterium]
MTTGDYHKILKQKYQQAFQIGLYMLFSIFLLWLAAFFVDQTVFAESERGELPVIFRIIILCVSLLGLFCPRVLKMIILEHNPMVQTSEVARAIIPKLAGILFSYSITVLAFCEAPAVYGFFFFFLTRQMTDFYILLGITAVGFAMNFPKYGYWEAWVEKHIRHGKIPANFRIKTPNP